MTTDTTETATAAGQIAAAGALLAIVHAHRALPTPSPELREISAAGTWSWGVRLSLHDGLDQFEQWRDALALDPADVNRKHSYGGNLAWLIVTGTAYGVPVELVGYYYLPEPATTWS
ncbi:hypothetical protein [Kitasatospora sp. NPDC002965]|uniref:hypothetical protein n=1 Tax=Kitasatospora sp. NPDC002965 TaxID=3154775 RepID=UPI0033A95B51